MGIDIKDFLERKLLSYNSADSNASGVSAKDGSNPTVNPVDQDPREGRRGQGTEPRSSALNFPAIPAPNKWRGSKIKVHDKSVIQAQKQERSTQNLRKAQSRKDEIRLEQEQTNKGISSNAQATSQEVISTPGIVADRRRIYTVRNGLMSYKAGKSGLKRGKKKANASSVLVRLHRPTIKSRAHRSPKKKSPTVVRKRREPEVDSEEGRGKAFKKRSLAGAPERAEENRWGKK
ncbi:hypothetical protein BDM02DRAFT_3266235 [Thelephora ganbajun]|uniref:Uncharacterized protein n=1 Tax=Thelephora ganbajun TaxID=370292 RepID=A0ACB6ZS86_THEGA|nr:hypothetical protein BDM02DRAFT_3266235 [Thelephora ganbajun]